METRMVPWQSADKVNGYRLLAEFDVRREESRIISIHAGFTYTGAQDDSVHFYVHLEGDPRQIQHPFRHNNLQLDGAFSVVRFDDPPGQAREGVWGDLSFGFGGTSDRIYFEGVMVELNGSNGPPPPPNGDACADDSESDINLGNGGATGVFPYIFLRKWSRLCTADCRCYFVDYSPGSPPGDTLFEHLATASPNTWEHLQEIVDLYVEGQLKTNYPFLSDVNQVQGCLGQFAHVYRCLRRETLEAEVDVRKRILEILGVDKEELVEYLGSAEYQWWKEDVWQSYFALLIKLGCRVLALEDFAETLLGAAFIEWAFAEPPHVLSDGEIRKRLNASIELPDQVFPLPPPSFSPPRKTEKGTASPFALGDLQMIRHRLVRYEPGDLARVENVMGGEKKQRSLRNLVRSEESTGESSSLERVSTSENGFSNLFQETIEAVAAESLKVHYDNFKVNYGPPTTATLTGGWDLQRGPGSPPSDMDLTKPARQLVGRTLERVSKRVEEFRLAKSIRESEDTEKSVIDNTGNQSNLVGIYRWLNRIYCTQLYQYGLRLMVKFVLHRPAKHFLAVEEERTGSLFHKPVSPERRGIDSFESLNQENYAQLFSIYGVTADLVAPQPTRTVTAALQWNDSKEVLIPAGYQAARAYVTRAAPSGGAGVVQGVVGRQPFTLTGDTPSDELPMAQEEQAVPAILAGDIVLTPPATNPQELAVTIEIRCQPSPYAYRQWQIRAYNAIVEGYNKQLALYRQKAGVSTDPRSAGATNPQFLETVERRELRRECLEILEAMNLESYAFDRDDIGSPPRPEIEDFAYIDRGFFEEIMEWKEMSYWYSYRTGHGVILGSPIVDDELEPGSSFSEFVQADTADVVVPVRPDRALSALYFFRSGMIWAGRGWLVPANPGDQALVCELKRASLEPTCPRRVGEPWEVAVPTSDQILAGSEGVLAAISESGGEASL